MRSAAVDAFLSTVGSALGRTSGPAAELAAEVIARWTIAGTIPKVSAQSAPLSVCDHLDEAISRYPGALSAGFAAIAPMLVWKRRPSAQAEDQPFYNGHANAAIFGPGGLEEHPGLWIGATIMAPNITYPRHDHPPAEVYLPLTPGEWWNAEMDWTDPGPDGFIYNPPGIKHAMRSGPVPFLALWVLPV